MKLFYHRGQRRFMIERAAYSKLPRRADGTPALWSAYEVMATASRGPQYILLDHVMTKEQALALIEQATTPIQRGAPANE